MATRLLGRQCGPAAWAAWARGVAAWAARVRFMRAVAALGPLFVVLAIALVGLCAREYFAITLPLLYGPASPLRSEDADPTPAAAAAASTARLLHTAWATYLLVCIAVHYYYSVVTDPGWVSDAATAGLRRKLAGVSRDSSADGDNDDDAIGVSVDMDEIHLKYCFK
ncbi:hypothetical protein HK405_007750, partial [Cladochytrium tenue]